MRNQKWSNALIVVKSLKIGFFVNTSGIFMRNGDFHVSFAVTRLNPALI